MNAALRVEAADLLDKAADDIHRYGHHKGGHYPDRDPYPFVAPRCAIGSIWLAAGENPRRLNRRQSPAIATACRRLRDHLIAAGAVDGMGVVSDWNDDYSRTKAEVVAALRAAAEKARAS